MPGPGIDTGSADRSESSHEDDIPTDIVTRRNTDIGVGSEDSVTPMSLPTASMLTEDDDKKNALKRLAEEVEKIKNNEGGVDPDIGKVLHEFLEFSMSRTQRAEEMNSEELRNNPDLTPTSIAENQGRLQDRTNGGSEQGQNSQSQNSSQSQDSFVQREQNRRNDRNNSVGDEGCAPGCTIL